MRSGSLGIFHFNTVMIEYYKNLDLADIKYVDEEGVERIEEWRDFSIKYKYYYQGSNLGRIKGLERDVKHAYGGFRTLRESIKKQSLWGEGYLSVSLVKKGKTETINVHILVAMAFLGHVPCGHEKLVDHKKNEDRLNNCIWNLQIITARGNVSKDKKGGTSKYVGVSYREKYNHWRSAIRIGKSRIEIGAFKIEEDAGKAYLLAVENIDKFDGDIPKFRALVKSLL